MSETIPMVREGVPARADVHPAEEANYAAHGWVRVAAHAAAARVPAARSPEETPESVEDERVSVHKVVDGEPNERASRANLTRAEAEAYVAARPEHEYLILRDED